MFCSVSYTVPRIKACVCIYVCRALQARVTRHVMSGIGQEKDDDVMEIEEPSRKTLVELKSVGKKKAVAPISRGSSIIHRKRYQGHGGLMMLTLKCFSQV